MHFKALVIGLLILLLVAAPAESWWRRRRRRRRSPPPPPDTTPPTFSGCPGSITRTTTAADARAVVYYPTPTASDNRGSVSVSRTGLASGSRFPEGVTHIRYCATDSAGNTAYCSFSVTINVPRCASISASNQRSRSCTKSNIVGSWCHFQCPTGYDLIGSASSYCRSCRRWSQPFPTCQDIQPPNFSFCPSGISVEAEDGLTSAVVSWNVPTATDNEPSGLTVSRPQGSAPGSRFSEGTHRIRYRARDGRGNTQDCTFTVTVRVIRCTPVLQSCAHGTVSCPHGNIKGASCSFGCDAGYRLVGVATTTCESTGSWSSPQPSCQIMRCTTLVPPSHGRFIGSHSCGNAFGTRCRFACDTGYSITGSSARRCVANQGQTGVHWSGTATGCQINLCQAISPGQGLSPVNPGSCSAGRQVQYGATCTYACAEGFRLSGAQALTCGPDSEWLQALPECEAITCASSDLPAPANGVKSGCSRDQEPYGTTCTLSCNRGYRPTTAVQRTCGSNSRGIGVWSGGTITCRIVRCPLLSAPAHGTVIACERNGHSRSPASQQPFDTTCRLACHTGYTLSGSASRTCLVTGAWDGSSATCSDVTAPALTCPSDQVIFAEEGQEVVSVSWDWEPVTGTDASHSITAALLTMNSAPVSGARPTSLQEGTHSLVYGATDSAGNSGSCSMQIEAKVTRCSGLPTPIQGVLRLVTGHGSCTEGAVYGSQCEFSCETGYTLSTEGGTLQRRCMRATANAVQGYWSSSQPTCVVNTCTFPTITNGYIAGCHGDSATFGDSCEFRCDLGHRSPSGHSYRSRRCQADGSWSGADFQCTVTVTCPGPFSVPHGTIQPAACGQDETLPYDTVCHFSCGDGFRREGPAIKTCQDHREWDNLQNVVCIDEQSPRFSHGCPQHVTVNSELGSTSQTVNFSVPTATDNSGFVTVTRQAGHLAPGSRFSERNTVVTFIATDPRGNSDQCDVIVTVVVYRCERLQAPTSGSIQCGNASPIAGTQCTVECNTGYTLSGSQTRTCRLTSDDSPYWDGQAAVCTIVRCPSQPAPPHAIKSDCSLPSEPYGTECSFYCERGYETETSDDGRSRCLANGTWSGTDLVCNEVECPALTAAPGIVVTPSLCSSQPLFGQGCTFSCSQQGFRIEPVDGVYTRCGETGAWSLDVSEIHCVDVTNPRFTNCPSALTIYADRGSTRGQLDLQITAADNDDLQPTVTCDPGSGEYDLGTHDVSCIAIDAAGNSATCSFQVEVIEHMCPALPVPAYGEYVGDCCSVYGCDCQLTCIDGYRLVGSSEATCEFNGTSTYWQQVEIPHCELITCNALLLPASVQVTPSVCTSGSPQAGTQCFVFCLNRLSLVGGVSQVLCGEQGLWDTDVANLPTDCEDHIPPVLTSCPGPIYVTREGQAGASVTFDIPTACDNSPSGTLTREKSPADIDSPYLFTESTEVSYTFTDQGGNSVTCTFSVFIVDDLMPEVVFCPADQTMVPRGIVTEVSWDEPVFRDPLGRDLRVINNVAVNNTATLGWGRHMVMYMAINMVNGEKASCEFDVNIPYIGCAPLPNPLNGNIFRDPSTGTFSIFCLEAYRLLRPRGWRDSVPDLYACNVSSGRWSPHDKVLDCSTRQGGASLSISLTYLAGNCSEQATQDEIASAFTTTIQSWPFLGECSVAGQCATGNMRVQCGERLMGPSLSLAVNRRRRRDAAVGNADTTAEEDANWNAMSAGSDATNLKRQKRDVNLNFEVAISFNLSHEIDYGGGVDSHDALIAVDTELKNEADGLIALIRNGNLQAMSTPSITLEVHTISYDDSTVVCKPGYVISSDTYHCIPCSSGTRYNGATKECEYCPRGSYQGQQAQESCSECPPGTTTASEATRDSLMCKDMCPPGSYSADGIVPCYRCLIGEYQAQPGQTSCQACPPGTTTLDYGAQSLDQCQEVCPPGHYSDTGMAPCQPCEHRYYQPSSQKRHCILCPGQMTTSGTGSTSIDQCSDLDGCASSPCGHGGTCVDLIDGYQCECPEGCQGTNCEETVDDCVDHRCLHGATCVDGMRSYQCQCSPGFEGDFCEMNVDECASLPCQHDSVCRDGINGYQCQCTSSYHGAHCELERNSCSPSPCHNGAQCEILDAGYLCLCGPGYGGVNCTLNINECSSSPCQNGATCQDMVNGYNCICPTGYEGVHCRNDIDLCAGSPCYDGSTCVDLGTVFHCLCPPHRSGDLCEDTPCQNGALFITNPDAYTCQCVAGYAGHNCEVDVNECASGPCSNGGTCIEHQINAFRCDCPQGFEGDRCDIDINECLSSPCGAGNTCDDDVNGYTCLCGPGLTGSHCQDHIDYCEPSMCQHGATCSNTGAGYQCQCAAGFTGHDCDTNINECLSMPCQHQGSCVDHDNGFVCFCLTGFTGLQCETNIDDCSPSACQNDGTCVDGIADYSCVCPDGFTGTHCEELVDYCLSHSPCQHQATCENDPPGYKCFCPPGFVGRNCEEDFDECSSYPCMHASTCVDRVDGYVCMCGAGYIGTNCEIDVDECVSDPCRHGGTCMDLAARFTCRCEEGYTGTFCEEDINECASQPCQNGATCLDAVNEFGCICPQGWTGERCELDIDDCDSDPCENGGECQDQLNAYICQCLPGYSGFNCEVDIDECQQLDLPCQNGASCIDKVADFECMCPIGYRGRYCQEEIDECESYPCQNGGSCVDALAAFSCDCPIGFTGLLCDIQVDLCADVACSNGATCLSQRYGFVCICVAGYSGELCDVEIDECASQPCLHQGSCEDKFNGYQCTCLPGYTGDSCETELSVDFDLKFSNPTMSDLIQVAGLTSHDLSSLSLSLWLKCQTCSGDFILAKLAPPTARSSVIEIRNPSNLRVTLLGRVVAAGGQMDFCDGRWHNLMLTLTHSTNFQWKIYANNQTLAAEGAITSPITSIPSGLTLTIGPVANRRQDIQTINDCELELSGLNIWSNAWVEAEVPDIASYCAPHPPGSVFAWGQMMTVPGDAITRTLRAPSMCDDTDDCASSPCDHGGTCEDQLGAFLCHCSEGWMGDRCQTMVDLCLLTPCSNNGTCRSELLGFSCQCPAGYAGIACEYEIVDGQWGVWSSWSDCSVTCGTGNRLRYRACTDPEPQYGGAECPGNNFQSEECDTDSCPACPLLREPHQGFINCNETEVGERACYIRCRDGYAFSTPPQTVYRCGPSTDYTWDHNPENSRSVRLPRCRLIVPRVAVAANITVTYPSLQCSSSSDRRGIVDTASATLHNSTQGAGGCLADHTCAANVSVANCETQNHRMTRAAREDTTPDPVKLTITVTMDGHTVDGFSHIPENDTELLLAEFDTTLANLTHLLQTGGFGIAHDGEIAQPDAETIIGDEWDVCPEGSVESEREGYCVQCGEGSIWIRSNETQDYQCEPCPVNTYKDEWRNVCLRCPSGMVTIASGAVDISDCFEPPINKSPNALSERVFFIAVTVACIGVILIIGAIGLGIFLKLKLLDKRKKRAEIVMPSPVHIIPDIFETGPGSHKNMTEALAASQAGDALPEATPTPSDVPDVTGILEMPNTKL